MEKILVVISVFALLFASFSSADASGSKGISKDKPGNADNASRLIREMSSAGFIGYLWSFKRGASCAPFEMFIRSDGDVVAFGIKTDFDATDRTGQWLRSLAKSDKEDGALVKLRNADCAINIILQEQAP